jgi:hypothetical protein
MGYADKTITLDYSSLGEGCSVTLRNPQLFLRTIDDDPNAGIRPDGTVDMAVMKARSRDRLTKLIAAWTVWDVDTDEPLPLPSADPSVFDRAPEFLINELMREVMTRMNPQRPQKPA